VSTIQGNFLDPDVQRMTKRFVAELHRRQGTPEPTTADTASYVDREKNALASLDDGVAARHEMAPSPGREEKAQNEDRLVDVGTYIDPRDACNRQLTWSRSC
jgi:hypothetical protein